MNIKSLLLGSAAALVAVSGARAADAVIAPEPEPVEYVRVCDVYGTSFYYIPGTEICLKVGGYLRYDIGVGDLAGDTGDTGDQTYYKRARFQLRMDARTETELGTLRGYFAGNFNFVTTEAIFTGVTPTNPDGYNFHDVVDNQEIEHAYVELGGFRIGATDSLFSTETGYAGDIIYDDLIAYGPFKTHQIAYTFDAGNGFSISGAVEEGNSGNYTTDPESGEDWGVINDYAPHAVLGAAYSGGIWGASIVGGYDSSFDEFSVKGRIDVRPNDMFSLFIMGAWTDDDDGSGGNFYAAWGGDWGLWVGAAAKFNDTFKLNGQFSMSDLEDYAAVADLNITVVPGFVVTPGVAYTQGDGDPLSYVPEGDNWGGYLRTQFTF